LVRTIVKKQKASKNFRRRVDKEAKRAEKLAVLPTPHRLAGPVRKAIEAARRKIDSLAGDRRENLVKVREAQAKRHEMNVKRKGKQDFLNRLRKIRKDLKAKDAPVEKVGVSVFASLHKK